MKDDMMLVDRWILSKLQRTIKEVTDAIETYNFNIAAKSIYSFFWDEFCDWYIEAVKPRLKDHQEKTLVQNILIFVLDASLKLLHPIMPFLTEELWQKLPVKGESIMVAPWPEFDERLVDEISENEFEVIKEIIRSVRSVRAEMGLPQSTRVKVHIKID